MRHDWFLLTIMALCLVNVGVGVFFMGGAICLPLGILGVLAVAFFGAAVFWEMLK